MLKYNFKYNKSKEPHKIVKKAHEVTAMNPNWIHVSYMVCRMGSFLAFILYYLSWGKNSC